MSWRSPWCHERQGKASVVGQRIDNTHEYAPPDPGPDMVSELYMSSGQKEAIDETSIDEQQS